MYSPIPHDLSIYDGEFDFEKNGFCPHQWEISVPQKNCITWGVVLSYLRTADFTEPGKFEERLSRLTDNAFDPETVSASILDFNPFFNIHKCFFDETLQNVSQSFRKVLNENRPPKAPKTIPHDMQLISTFLKSNILIVDLSKKKLHLVTPSDGYSTDLAAITLLCREYWNNNGKKPFLMKRFTFSLDKDLCWELRRDAFNILVESSDIRGIAEKEIQLLIEKKEKKVNILISLLKKNHTHVISELYDSSYTVAKLADAGFETDPSVLDADEFSAFYYALQSNDNNVVYILYRYASSNCYEFESSFRDPNPRIISNLLKFEEVLKGDYLKSNNFELFGETAEQARVAYQDLLRFNEFLIQVCKGINKVREIPEDSSVKRAEKQKEIILLLLEKYDAFYSVGQLDSQEEVIENYTKHKTYYDNLDITVALLFFDNIFLLKSVLRAPEERLYSELESSFILSAVTNKYFTFDAKNRKKFEDLRFELDFINFSIIPILERLNLREEVKNFCSILRKKKMAEEDIVHCIQLHEMSETLSSCQELKDEFLISRLDHYMKAALEMTPEGMKQKFVIEKALLVIGEAISIEETETSSIKHLLRKCLTSSTLEILKKARNTLSHLKSSHFRLKFDTEEDNSLFTSIQSEIRNMKEVFEKVFDVQRVRLKEYLINRGLETVQKLQKNISIDIHPLVPPMKNLSVKLRKKITESESEILDQKGTDGSFLVPNINEFSRRLMRFASKVQVKQILDEIPLEVQTRVVAIEKLEHDLELGIPINVDRFDSLFLKKKDLESFRNEYIEYLEDKSKAEPGQISMRSSLLHRIKKSPNPLNILYLIFEKKNVSDSQLKALYAAIPFSDKTKSTLNSLIQVSKGPYDNDLFNILNRIKHLYHISIDEQSDVRFLWERAKSCKAKQYLVYKIVHRYFREPSFQASLEMLLFDCFGILQKNAGSIEKRKSKEEIIEDQNRMESVWLKDSYLFNGIDVRNVLAHGDLVLESIGNILDPKDLPSELVKKMLQFFEDRECIETLCDVWQKGKQSDKNSDNSFEWYKLKERIVCCPRWEEYFKLLPEDPKESEICESLVSFLKNVTESKRKNY